MKLSTFALVGASALVAAQPHAHNHMHRHPARHGSPVEGRDVAVHTETQNPVATVFDLGGKMMPWSEELAAGIKDGSYVVLSGDDDGVETIAPTSAPAPAPKPTSSVAEAAEFIQKPETPVISVKPTTSSSVYVAPTTSSSVYVAPTTSAAPKSSAAPAASSSSSSSSSGSSNGYLTDGIDYTDLTGVNTPFPDGKISCSDFPSEYGARAANWLGIESWTGVQIVPGFTFGVSDVISYIETSISGMGGCVSGSMCSYACPNGYAKTQWSSAQGNTGQSIGGLFCGSDNLLHMTNTDFDTLCTAGAGYMQVENNLDEEVCFCATDYPGTEGETIATCIPPGGTRNIFNTDAPNYYKWKGGYTSNQVYINKKGLGPSDACWWNTLESDAGNYAPVNLGLSVKNGLSWPSLLPNSVANPDGKLGYDVVITGDAVSGKGCKYENETYKQQAGDVWTENPKGCTASCPAGNMVTIQLNESA